jgi:hypothetical protein
MFKKKALDRIEIGIIYKPFLKTGDYINELTTSL